MSLRVFSQFREPRLDGAAFGRAATQFFGVTLAVTGDEIALGDAKRRVSSRLREENDLRDALEAERRTGFTGLYDLAERRCPTLWVVEREGPDDRVALRIAAILATVGLGPILDGAELFGVRTARRKLDG
jgi:hypothetical protein